MHTRKYEAKPNYKALSGVGLVWFSLRFSVRIVWRTRRYEYINLHITVRIERFLVFKEYSVLMSYFINFNTNKYNTSKRFVCIKKFKKKHISKDSWNKFALWIADLMKKGNVSITFEMYCFYASIFLQSRHQESTPIMFVSSRKKYVLQNISIFTNILYTYFS